MNKAHAIVIYLCIYILMWAHLPKLMIFLHAAGLFIIVAEYINGIPEVDYD